MRFSERKVYIKGVRFEKNKTFTYKAIYIRVKESVDEIDSVQAFL